MEATSFYNFSMMEATRQAFIPEQFSELSIMGIGVQTSRQVSGVAFKRNIIDCYAEFSLIVP